MLRALHHMSTLVVSPSRHKKLLSVSTKAFAIAADSPNIVRSAYNVDIPRNIPLSHFILDAASKAKDKAVAFVDGVSGQELLFGELRGRIATAAAGFAARGVSSGDVVAVVLANCAEYAIVFHGASVAGGVVSPLNPSYTSFEIEHQLKDSGAKVVVTSSAFDATVRAAAGKLGIAVVTLGSPEAAFLAKADPQAELPPPPSDFSAATALAALPYSSGTTGLPKGVRLSHLNLIANILQVNAVPEHNCGHKPAGSVMLGVLPFFHIYGSTLILQSGLWLGAKVVTLPKFEPVTFLELLERHRVTFAPLVPPIIQMLARHPIVDKYDLSSLEIVFSGAAPLDADTQTLLQKRLPHVSVRQGYGLTESAPVHDDVFTLKTITIDELPGAHSCHFELTSNYSRISPTVSYPLLLCTCPCRSPTCRIPSRWCQAPSARWLRAWRRQFRRQTAPCCRQGRSTRASSSCGGQT